MSNRISRLSPPRDEHLRALVCGMDAERRKRCRIVMLQAFIDDSGNDPNNPKFVLAGFVSTVEKWERFSDEWRIVLNKEPKLEYFKASEARFRTGQFAKGWNRPLIEQRVYELAEVATRNVERRIHAVVDRPYWDVWITPIAKDMGKSLGEIFEHPYWQCFYTIATGAADIANALGHDDPCELVFDEQGQLGKAAAASWDSFREVFLEEKKGKLGSVPTFRDEKKVLPLQAADLYAWHVHAHAIANAQGQSISPNVSPLLARIDYSERQYGREDIINIRKTIIRIMDRAHGVTVVT